MNSSIVKDIREAYNSVYYSENNLFEDIVDFCIGNSIFETSEETQYFANLIIHNDLALTFIEDALEYYAEEELLEETYIAEVSAGLLKAGLKAAGGVLKKVTPAVRGLPAKTLAKKGYTPGGFSSTGKQLGKVNKPALATQTRSIQQARAARKPPEAPKANKYANMLAAKKAATPAPSTKPTASKSGGMTPSYVAKRGVTDTLATTLALGMGHMAGLKPATNIMRQMTTPIVKTVKDIATRTAPTVSTATARAPKPTFKPEALPKTQKLAEPGGALVSTKAPKPTFKPEALPKVQKGSQPGGALVSTRAPKPTFKPEALPKVQKGSQPGGALVSTRAPKPTSKSGLSPEGQAIQRLNKMTGGGPLGTRELPKLSHRAPKPAWGAGATPPKPQQSPGQAQRSVDLPPSKTTSSTKPSKKTPTPSTGKGGSGGGLTYTTRATLSPTEKAGNMKYPGLEKYATGSGPGTGGAKPSKKSMTGRIAAGAAGAAALAVANDSEKEQRKQQKTIGVSNIEKPKKKVTGEDVRKSFDTAFATERKLKGSSGTFRWTNPSTGKSSTYTTKMKEESMDNFDLVLESLLIEGYSNDEALKIMSTLDEAAVTKLLLKLQKSLPKLSAKGKELAGKIMQKQGTTAADLERQKMSPVRKQQTKQRQEREGGDKYGHPSLSAAERNSSLR